MQKITRNFNGLAVTAEIINTKRQFKWRLVAGKVKSEWYSYYEGLLVLEVQGRKFAYASDYWNGTLPVETPFEII